MIVLWYMYRVRMLLGSVGLAVAFALGIVGVSLYVPKTALFGHLLSYGQSEAHMSSTGDSTLAAACPVSAEQSDIYFIGCGGFF